MPTRWGHVGRLGIDRFKLASVERDVSFHWLPASITSGIMTRLSPAAWVAGWLADTCPLAPPGHDELRGIM